MKRRVLSLVIAFILIASIAYGKPLIFRAGNHVDRPISTTIELYKTFMGDHFVTQAFAILDAAEKTQVIINTPAFPYYVHLNIMQTSSSESYFELWRSPTVSDLGNSVSILNRNDNLADTSGVEITRYPTVTDAGILRDGFGEHIGAGQLKGGNNTGLNIIVLRPNTTYMVNSISEGANNHVDVIIDFCVIGGSKF